MPMMVSGLISRSQADDGAPFFRKSGDGIVVEDVDEDPMNGWGIFPRNPIPPPHRTQVNPRYGRAA